MRVEGLLNPLLVTARGDEALEDVGGRMGSNDVGSAGVLEEGRLVGIITERDFTRAAADGADPRTVRVSEYMTSDPVVVEPTMDSREAGRAMVDLGVRHLPVVQGDKLVGFISMRDILLDLVRD